MSSIPTTAADNPWTESDAPPQVTAAPGSSPAYSRRKLGIQLGLSLLLGLGCLGLLQAGALPVLPPSAAWQHLAWWAIPAYLGIWSLVHGIRAWRWRWLLAPLAPVGPRVLFPVSFLGFAAVLFLPFRTGEVVRPLLLGRSGAVSGWAATGTIAAERVIDGLLLSLMLVAGLAARPHLATVAGSSLTERAVDLAAVGALALFFTALVSLIVFYRAAKFARRWVHRLVGWASAPLASWISDRGERVAQGLSFLPRLRFTLPFLGETVAYWLLNALAAWLLALGCGFDTPPWSVGPVVVGVLALGILVPSAPGFFGAFQLSVYAGLLLFFPHGEVENRGAVYVLVMYSSQLLITAMAALISLLWKPFNPHKRQPA